MPRTLLLIAAQNASVAGRVGILVALLVGVLLALVAVWLWVEHHKIDVWGWVDPHWRKLVNSPTARAARARHPRFWAFLGRRVSRKEYLGLHITVGFAVSVVALLVFTQIARGMVQTHGKSTVDMEIAAALHQNASPAGVNVAKAVSFLGAPVFVTLLTIALSVALLARGRKLLGMGVAFAVTCGGVLDVALKSLFRRPRPVFPDPFDTAASWSFPSGHSLGSLVAYGMLAYALVLIVRDRRARVGIAAGAAFLVAAIGFTRMYLGVHYFTDVIGGFTVGAVWLTACITGLEVARMRRSGPGAPVNNGAPNGVAPERASVI